MELLIKKKYRIKCNIENKLYYMFKNSKWVIDVNKTNIVLSLFKRLI
jgi:hypothetical protein